MHFQKFLKTSVIIIALLLCLSDSIYAAVVHRVAPSESLYLIAKSYRSTVNDIVKKNNLRNPETIYPRQVLIISGVNKYDIYRVELGDSLYSIGKKLGYSVVELAQENNLWDLDQITPGQILFLPPKKPDPVIIKPIQPSQPTKPSNPDTYVVQAGDTLFRIALKLKVDMDELAKVNNLDDNSRNNLYQGQNLKIPTNKVTKPAKPAPVNPVPQLLRNYPDTFYLKGTSNSNKIALTFDDGPDSVYTEQVLDVLKSHNVPATFFVVGMNVESNNPEIINRIVNENHVIASHSWSHPNLSKQSASTVFAEINQTEKVIEEITGLKTALIRPPYGGVSEELVKQLKELNYKVINWSVDSVDWRDKDVDQILINTLPSVKDGAILLFHSGGGTEQDFSYTVKVLPELIETLKILGYEFVTVDNLLNVPAYKS